ncbi:hypothetical protein A0128_00405 [Leptospira tipperaryensis]|uniref:Methylamine utilisation protein MauE domain-containing protein n=1 Tax=Leptospira tipperaryensis TaxID=2564040 RepID=A0A1D7USD3_9LEPT|nr:MauE/DoxX family redox-associated membrane protein [Leptospira tipperaryensis]AOP32475.1 hypothetical protein A0128_00405 [Leptospira tipperaryensis]
MENLEQSFAMLVLRLALGFNILIHGLVRITSVGAFREFLIKDFENTPLPTWSVAAFGTVLPFLETVIGALLVLGLFSKWALLSGGLLMIALISGKCLQSDWHTVGVQMIYVFFYFFLLKDLGFDQFNLDTWLGRIGK